MEERLTEILRRNFSGARIQLNNDAPAERISGSVLWDGFAGHDLLWRQNTLDRVLRRKLGPEASAVSHLFTYTPNEYEQMMSVA